MTECHLDLRSAFCRLWRALFAIGEKPAAFRHVLRDGRVLTFRTAEESNAFASGWNLAALPHVYRDICKPPTAPHLLAAFNLGRQELMRSGSARLATLEEVQAALRGTLRRSAIHDQIFPD